MKFATWNVNSLRVRLPQVLDWLQSSQTDVLCLQELKMSDDQFPLDAFTELGYNACWAGQKTYNGVAIVSRTAGHDVQRNIPGFDDEQQRVIATTLDCADGPVRVISAYCPNGQSVDSDKYTYKLAWYQALHAWLEQELQRYPRLLILGDYNIAPTDDDVHDPELWADKVLVSDPERQALQALIDLGLHDAFRLFDQEPRLFSWWDYRQLGFRRNAGLRIDHILVSDALRAACQSCVIDKEPRRLPQPSDHAPVIAQFDLVPA